MYAIVEIAGKQFKVSKDQRLYTPKLSSAVGDSLTLDKVLLVDDGNGGISVGAPILVQAEVQAKVLQHAQGDKVIVFKKKRRNGYKVKRGHRQLYTQILIEDIIKRA